MEEDYEDVLAVINRQGGGEQDLRNALREFVTIGDDNTYLSDNVKHLEYFVKLTEEGKESVLR